MGATYRNEYDQFSQILSEKTESYFDEVKKVCETNSVKEEFYDLCECIVDVGLNVKKWKTEENQVQGLFYDTDINIAKQKVIEFVEKYEISNHEEFLLAVETIYHYAAEWGDKRGPDALIFNETEKTKWDSPRIGWYCSLTQLPKDIWNKIKEEISEEIKRNIGNMKK